MRPVDRQEALVGWLELEREAAWLYPFLGARQPELADAARALDPAGLDDAAFDGLLEMAGLAGGSGEVALPEQMAPVNALLDVAPPALREALLVAFLDRLTR